MRIRKSRKIEPSIPTASMADLSFLLIIFFMVTTVFQVDRTSVKLPLSSERDEIPRGSAFVVVTQEGALKFSNGSEESRELRQMEDVYFAALQLTSSAPGLPFVIKADEAVRCAAIDQVMDALRRARVQKIILLTNQEHEGGEGAPQG
jgi:biopolymer transport protein ExbD